MPAKPTPDPDGKFGKRRDK
jgi:hypothetical protein